MRGFKLKSTPKLPKLKTLAFWFFWAVITTMISCWYFSNDPMHMILVNWHSKYFRCKLRVPWLWWYRALLSRPKLLSRFSTILRVYYYRGSLVWERHNNFSICIYEKVQICGSISELNCTSFNHKAPPRARAWREFDASRFANLQ